MSVQDIRLHVSFWGHVKRLKLEGRLGAKGVLGFIDLMLHVAPSRPDGILHGYGPEEIAISSKYIDDAQSYADTLVDVGLLDQDEDGTYSIHDWSDYQNWAVSAEDRSNKGRMASLRRYQPALAAELEAKGVYSLSAPDYQAILKAYKKQQSQGVGELLGTHMGTHGSPSGVPMGSPCSISNSLSLREDSVPKKMTRKKQGHDPKNDPANDPGFLEFWSRYPRKVKKPEAVKAWAKLNGDKPELSVMLSALDRQKASPEWNREGGRFIPHPSTWLSHKRWEDETTIQDDVRSVPEDRKWERPEGWADPNWLLEMDQQLRASEGQDLRGENQGEGGECNGSHESIKI